MKTIEIQNCTGVTKTYMFKVKVNGEEYVMRNQFLNVEVEDDMPFEIEIKYFLGSPVYKFEPKDNTLLQVWVNRRMLNRVLILMAIGIVSVSVVAWMIDSRILLLLCLIISLFQVIMKKKLYFIREKSIN